jgi:Na+-transporting methylmalonyl-CoA/oxaloacetate decarboxylase gamma subunit
MAKRRGNAEGEVSLFPFLSILACLIGALVLMIVVLVISQMGKAEGRTPEEIQRAQDYIKLKKEIEERKELDVVLKEKLAQLEEIRKQIEEKEQQYVKLRKLLSTSKDIQDANLKISQQMQKELDDLLLEIEGMKKQQAESKKEIETLMAEIKKRDVPPDKKIPPVVVQPSGSGMSEDSKVYFVEAAGGGLKILGAWGEDYRLSATAEVVVSDVAYNHLLTEIAKNPKALLLFLIRDDGQGAFNNGAGRAANDYNIRVGKLPIPGKGVLDLAMFDKYRGKIAPPPAATPATPPDGAKPPAPSK